MALNVELWVKEITKNLYPTNEFYNFAKNDNAFINGKTVHRPMAGAMPTALINPSFPLIAAVKRTDSDVSYNLVNIVSPQVYVDYTEDIEFSYDILSSYTEDIIAGLNAGVGTYTAYEWANTPGTNIIRTSGAARLGYAANQTGNRKKMVIADLRAAARIMDNANVPQENRKLLVDGNLYSDILEMVEFKDSYILTNAVVSDNFVGRIAGFDVYKRSTVVRYNTGATAKLAVTAATAATTQMAAIAWHPSFVAKANSGVEMFGLDRKDPSYLQYVISAAARYGAAKTRTDEVGVVTIVEEASA